MFELATRWVLFAAPLPLILWFFIPRARFRLSVALKVPFFSAIDDLVEVQKTNIYKQKYFSISYIKVGDIYG